MPWQVPARLLTSMSSPSRDSLQPSLLDRLVLNPTGRSIRSKGSPAIGKQQLRNAVLRDMEWLLNARPSVSPPKNSAHVEQADPLNQSVLAFGMPPLAGKTATTVDIADLEKTIHDLIARYEPRIDPESLKVKALFHEVLMNQHNMVGLEISGMLWARPYPMELVLRTQLDLETGHVNVQSQ